MSVFIRLVFRDWFWIEVTRRRIQYISELRYGGLVVCLSSYLFCNLDNLKIQQHYMFPTTYILVIAVGMIEEYMEFMLILVGTMLIEAGRNLVYTYNKIGNVFHLFLEYFLSYINLKSERGLC